MYLSQDPKKHLYQDLLFPIEKAYLLLIYQLLLDFLRYNSIYF